MSDQEIHIQVHTGSDGMVHLDLDIATDMIDRDIQLTVSYESSGEETPKEHNLNQILENAKPPTRLAKYAETITLSEDPLSFQEPIRSEW